MILGVKLDWICCQFPVYLADITALACTPGNCLNILSPIGCSIGQKCETLKMFFLIDLFVPLYDLSTWITLSYTTKLQYSTASFMTLTKIIQVLNPHEDGIHNTKKPGASRFNYCSKSDFHLSQRQDIVFGAITCDTWFPLKHAEIPLK